MSTPLVSIVIPAFNQLDYCRQCIETLRAHTAGAYRLILVDNGSTDGVGAYFDSIPDAIVVHTGSNLGFAGGVNAGLAHAQGHVLLLNSDTILPMAWLDRLLPHLERPHCGIVGPRSNCVSGGQQIDGLQLESLEGINAIAEDLAAGHAGESTEVERLVGFCMLIHADCFRALGMLDEQFGIGNFEDDDYCRRARAAGFRLYMAEDAFVFHYGSRTFLGMGLVDEGWQTLMERNQKKYAEKWGEDLGAREDRIMNSRARNLAAQEAFKGGNPRLAIECLREAIGLAPGYEQNYNDLGVILWALGESSRAVKYFEQALRLNPAHAEAAANLNEARRTLGDDL